LDSCPLQWSIQPPETGPRPGGQNRFRHTPRGRGED